MLLAVTAFAAPSAAQIPGLPDVPDLPEAPELPPVPVVPDEPPPPPIPLLAGSSSGSGSSADEGGTTTARSGSGGSSSGAGARRSGGERTRFDRLPRRYEALLERILRGRGVEANLRRLERALASASPELRARIERLVRREIAALGRGDVSPQDRRRIERLRRVEALFAPAASAAGPGDVPSAYAAAAGGDSGAVEPSQPPAPAAGSGTKSSASAPQITEPKADRGSGLPGLPLPDDLTLGAVVVALMIALLALAGIAFALAATPSGAVPAGRARAMLRSSRSNLAFTGLVALAATMLVLLVGALI